MIKRIWECFKLSSRESLSFLIPIEHKIFSYIITSALFLTQNLVIYKSQMSGWEHVLVLVLCYIILWILGTAIMFVANLPNKTIYASLNKLLADIEDMFGRQKNYVFSLDEDFRLRKDVLSKRLSKLHLDRTDIILWIRYLSNRKSVILLFSVIAVSFISVYFEVYFSNFVESVGLTFLIRFTGMLFLLTNVSFKVAEISNAIDDLKTYLDLT